MVSSATVVILDDWLSGERDCLASLHFLDVSSLEHSEGGALSVLGSVVI